MKRAENKINDLVANLAAANFGLHGNKNPRSQQWEMAPEKKNHRGQKVTDLPKGLFSLKWTFPFPIAPQEAP